MKLKSQFTRVFCVFAALAGASLAHTARAYDRMVVFGDSLSDIGNLSIAAGPGVFPALNYDPFRATDGPTTTPASTITGVMVEQLNALLGLPPLTASLLGGSDYAWGRATTDFNTPDLVNGIPPGTGTQVATYLATHPSLSADSLYVVWGGANDLVNGGSIAGIQNAETSAITNLQVQIKGLLDAGAKNILWLNIADLSLTPTGRAAPAPVAAQLHASSEKFRTDWALSLQLFDWVYPDATITGVDVYSFLTAVVANPGALGLTNATDPAQGLAGVNPDEYLFWDSLHPTTRGDQLLAQYTFQQLQAVPVPEPSSAFYLGFALLAVVARRAYVARRRNR